MVHPRQQIFQIMSLGSSIGTQAYPNGTLEADAIVVTSFSDLADKSDAEASLNPALW